MASRETTLLHLFWVGMEPPDFVTRNFLSWEKNFPGDVRIWNNSNIASLIPAEISYSSWPKAMLVDLLRVIAISKSGGWYCDADSIPGRKILPASDRIILVREESKRFCNGFFYAPKEHPFLTHWIREIETSIEEMWPENNFIPEVSGPHALSRAIYTYSLDIGAKACQDQLSVAPWGLFKFLGTSANLKRASSRNAAIHIAQTSWRGSTMPNLATRTVLGEFLFKLRQGIFANIFDFARNVIKHPYLIPTNKSEMRMFLNVDNYTLDSTINLDSLWKRLSGEDELSAVVRDLSVCGIQTYNEIVGEKLRFAGWEKIDNSRWLRPKITNLASRSKL